MNNWISLDKQIENMQTMHKDGGKDIKLKQEKADKILRF